MRYFPALLLIALDSSAAGHEIQNTLVTPITSFVSSDCPDNKVRPVIEKTIKASQIYQTTKSVSLKIQGAHTIQEIQAPNYIWVKQMPPTDIEAGYVPNPIAIYEYKFIRGEYEWQDDGKFELQTKSFDIIRSPSGETKRRALLPIMATQKKWVEISPGRIEKVLTGYVQPPPAIQGHRLVNNVPAVYRERIIPAVYKNQTIVISQIREPAVIQQSYGACMTRPAMNQTSE